MTTQTVTIAESAGTTLCLELKDRPEDVLTAEFIKIMQELASHKELSDFDITVSIQDKNRNSPKKHIDISLPNTTTAAAPPMSARSLHFGDF